MTTNTDIKLDVEQNNQPSFLETVQIDLDKALVRSANMLLETGFKWIVLPSAGDVDLWTKWEENSGLKEDDVCVAISESMQLVGFKNPESAFTFKRAFSGMILTREVYDAAFKRFNNAGSKEA